MKLTILTLLLLTLTTGCTTSTEYGKCVGVMELRQSDKEYELSTWNVFVGLIFSETVLVPVVVALDSLWCPVGQK